MGVASRSSPLGQGGSAAGLGTEQFVDVNMIPVAAIARIEVLKDGASAVYGADAVAGVVNLILKKDFEGTALTVSGGRLHRRHHRADGARLARRGHSRKTPPRSP
jgi:outer membrane receptor protein involved in Fe transport